MPVIKKHETLLDFAVSHGGSTASLFLIALANGLGITDDVAPGTDLNAVKVELKVARYALNPVTEIKRVLKKHQSLADFTTQHYGTAEALFVMAMLNGIGITDLTPPGTPLLVEQVEADIAAAFFNRGLDIATDGFANGFISITPRRGIGFMKIIDPAAPSSIDFKVS